MPASNILLGNGVFAIGATVIGFTRGGGSFAIEREYKEIEADGDLGAVKGRVRKIGSRAKLIMNALELLPANLPKMLPSTEVDTTTIVGHSIFQATDDIVDADYQQVTWTGKTKGGKAVVITLNDAINLEGLDLELADKDEVVAEITYTACYTDGDTTEPWTVDFTD